MAECLHCGVEFTPRHGGHVFHSRECRHRGEREPHERQSIDRDQIARLFGQDRELDERVRVDDWHPNPGTPWVELDVCDTVRARRRWYENVLLANR